MELLDSRRFTGANIVWSRPGAVLEVACSDADASRVETCWRRHARELLDAVGWNGQDSRARARIGGLFLAVSAPLDALYAATELNETAWARCVAELGGEPAAAGATPAHDAASLRALIAAESSVALRDLRAAAQEHGVAFLSDDEYVSVGLGRGALTWPATALPEAAEVDWSRVHDVPVGLVTGTNGKTTSVRLAARIAQAAGLNVALSSTDWVAINDTLLERGDYSGPGGARTALRHSGADVAILETARGGLLRRGLAVEHADAVLITTIAEDHLGDFGTRSLTELFDVKWIVTRALRDAGRAVLNADDEMLVRHAGLLSQAITWFSLDADNPVIRAHIAAGGEALVVRDRTLAHYDGSGWHELCAVEAIPLTLGGAARHNVVNALAAAGLTLALGLGHEAVVAGLSGTRAEHNPGRGQLLAVDGVDVLVDFAHNPQAMEAIAAFAARHPARRRALCLGQAGDRTDQLIIDLVRAAWRIGLDRIVLSELSEHARGRPPGEVADVMQRELLRLGAQPGQIGRHATELESLEDALSWARPGDLIVCLALADRDGVLARVGHAPAGSA